MIYTNYEEQESLMLHTKFLLEFGTDGPISKVFTICMVAILVTWTIYTNFGSPFLRTIHMKFSFDWHSDFRGEDDQALWITTTTTEHGY